LRIQQIDPIGEAKRRRETSRHGLRPSLKSPLIGWATVKALSKSLETLPVVDVEDAFVVARTMRVSADLDKDKNAILALPCCPAWRLETCGKAQIHGNTTTEPV